ncbi:MAG: hypothetical protein JW969_10080 [Spirochaetales bacterium]|nr:hypothetical protein [Spirochaetales bacterium]
MSGSDNVVKEFKSEKIDLDGVPYLGLPTGIIGKNFSLTKLAQVRNSPGWIVKDGEISEWKLMGTTKKDNNTYLYGPFVEGITLEEIFEKPMEEKLAKVRMLLDALILLKSNNFHLFKIHTKAILFLDSGGILFLPPATVKELLDIMPEETKLEPYVGINHPDFIEEKNDIFAVSAILYKMITGKLPQMSRTEEKIKDRIRNRKAVEPAYLVPELKPEISRLIMNGLKEETLIKMKLTDLQDAVNGWTKDGLFRDISNEEKEQVMAAGKKTEISYEKQYKRNRYIEKNWKKWLVIAVITIAVGSIIGVSVKNTVFRERVTKNFTPVQVVQTFYASINKIDYFTMADCVQYAGVSPEVDNTMNLYVISKQAMAYTRDSLYLPADKWDELGRPVPEKAFNKYLYGITGLTIKEKQKGQEPVFVASFEKWYSETDTDLSSPDEIKVSYVGKKITEELRLVMDKEYWVISSIDRKEEIDLPVIK